MFDVIAIGELLIDFAPVSVDGEGYPTVAANPGGAPANYLAALSKFGKSTALIGKVGNDAFGKLLLNTLETVGISTRGMIVDDESFTTLAFVTLDDKGDREFSFARKPGADTRISAEEVDKLMLNETKVLHFGTLSLTDEPARSATYEAVRYAKERGKLISFDPNLRRPLWKSMEEAKKQMLWGLEQADVIKISDEEVDFLFALDPVAGAEHILSAYGAKLVFVTCGADGCYCANHSSRIKVPGLSGLKVVDTTGAGDIFGGSAMYKLLEIGKDPSELKSDELEQVCSFAVRMSGLSVTTSGAIPSIPDKDE